MTVSLEIAKQLKEAGWDKETSMMHAERTNELKPVMGMLPGENLPVDIYPAPTTDELLEALPAFCGGWLLICKKDDNSYSVGHYDNADIGCPSYEFEASTPTDALALLWLELKKNGLLN